MIGINSQIATGGNSNANSGVGFAVPVNTVKQVVPKLQANGKIDRAWLGVATAGDPDRRRRRGCAGQPGRPRGTTAASGRATGSCPSTGAPCAPRATSA